MSMNLQIHNVYRVQPSFSQRLRAKKDIKIKLKT